MQAEAELIQAQVVPLYTRLLDAWNRRDADGFAGLLTETCAVVGFDGSQMNGRQQTASELRAIFADHPTASYIAKVREVRPLDSRVTLLRAVVGMVPPGQAALNPAVNAVQSVVFVWELDEAKIALLHNTPTAFHGRPHLAQQLTEELSEVLRRGRIVEIG